MTTAVNDRLADYTGDGSTVTFAFDFPISAASELELVEVTSAGVSSTLVYLTDYTVSIGSGGTGTITRTTAPASGSKLYIAGNTPSEQSAAYSDVDEFPATAHEGSMDAIVRVQQEIKRNLGRMPRYPFGETTAAAWPAAALRAGYVARFNATTGALEPSDLNDSELQDLTALTDAEKANIATVAEAIDDGTLDDLLNGSMLEVDTVAALKAVATTSLTTGRAVMTKGYYSIGDGGAAVYIYTSGGAGSENDATIIDATDAGGHYDMMLDGSRVSLAALGGRSSGNAAHATANRTAWQTAIDLEIPHFIPKGTGNYIIDAPEALTSSGTHAQSGAVVVDVPFDCEFERGAVVQLADDQYTHIMQVISGADGFRLLNPKFDHNYASNFLAASCTISNISQTHTINQASPICFNGGSRIKIENFECEDSVYGAIQTNPYTVMDLVEIDGLIADGCLAGIICNGDVETAGRYVRQMSVSGFKAKDTITEAMDINRGVLELTLNEPNCVNCYTFADHGEFHKEVIDIQDCVRVNVNNPVIELNRQSGTGLRIKASNDTREVSVTSPNIANAKLVTKQNMISTDSGDWTVETGVGISGGVLTWTGTSGDVDAQQTQNTALGVAYDLGTSDAENTKAFIVEVPVTVTSGTLFVSLGTGSNLTNSSYRSIAITESGRYTFVVFGDDGDTITFRGATFTGSVDLADVDVQENVGALIVIQNTQNVTITNPLLRSGSCAIQIYDLGNDTCDNISIDGGIIDSMVLDGVSIACHSNINSGVQVVTNLNISGLSMKSIGRYAYDIGRVEGGSISGGRLQDTTSDVEMRFHAGCSDIYIHGVNGKNGSYGIALDVDPDGIDAEEVVIEDSPGFVYKTEGQYVGNTLFNGKVVISRDAYSYDAADLTEAKEIYRGMATLVSETFSAGSNLAHSIQLERGGIDANDNIRFIMYDELGAVCDEVAVKFNWWGFGPNKFPLP